MRNNSVPEERVRQMVELMVAIGRKNSLRDPLAQLVEQSGLGPAQVHAVMWLFREGPLSMTALSKRLGINQKTVTGVVDRLEKAAFVERSREEADRRVVTVLLSRKGRNLGGQLERGLATNVRGMLGLLDERDQHDLFRILHNLHTNLQQTAAAGEPTEQP